MLTFLSKHVRDCIDACFKALGAAERYADVADTLAGQEYAREAADLAALCIRFMERQSQLASDVAAATVKACRAAATECAKSDSPEAVDCLDACRHAAAVLTDNAVVLSSFKQSRAGAQAQESSFTH